MNYGLPTSIEIRGKEYKIRSDFRDILELMAVLNDTDLTDQERGILALLIFYIDYDQIPQDALQEAVNKCCWFINGGKDNDEMDSGPVLMRWEQDFPLIIAPVNRVLGHDARSDQYMHWWTFLAAFQEIGDCTFAQVVRIRSAKRSGKPLDKSDSEWYRKNRKLVDMEQQYSDGDIELLKMWGGG